VTSYVIAELAEGEAGGFAPRGAVKQLWQSRDFETIVSGPAETGKTWGCLQYADALLWKYAGAQGAIVRKTFKSAVASAVRTFRRIVGDRSPLRFYGGDKPEWIDYPNGSRLWVIGLDDPQKVLSSERDFFFVNQAEELTLDDWQTLTTRCTGRGATMPYTRIFGDCNPGPPTHWIKHRASLRLLESRHEDNPTLYDDAGELTAQGIITMGVLDALTGVAKERLRYGRWAAAEGVVYEGYNANHLIDPFPIPSSWRRIRAIDFGFTNPFVCQWWAFDGDGRMYRYREIYRTNRIVEDHARDIIRLSAGENIEATVSDHDREDRETLHRHGVRTVAANKAIKPGIEEVESRFRKAGDGKPRIFFLRDALVERDEELLAKRQAICTEQEFALYVYPKGVDGRPIKEEPVKEHDHGMDAMRYAVRYRRIVPVRGQVIFQH